MITPLYQKADNMTDPTDRKIHRKIFGHPRVNGVWRIRYNKEIYKLYDDVALSTLLRSRDYSGLDTQQGGMTSYSQKSNGRVFRKKKVCDKA